MTTPTNRQIHQFILDYFDEEEFEEFCFFYFPEVRRGHFGYGMSMNKKVIELIDYCDRHQKMRSLLVALEGERKEVYLKIFASSQKITTISLPTYNKPQLSNLKPELIEQLKTHRNTFVHERTKLEFVHIPEGEFFYGEDNKRIHLPEYWISKTPVTHTVYQRFIDVNPWYKVPFLEDESWAKPYNWNSEERICPPDKTGHPVVLISWYDAVAFCEWAGVQLPTEEQWEKAARGTDGRTYPWGNNDPTNKLCNFDGNVGITTPVGLYSPQGDSSYGCVDMSGNVWEWCLNKYENPKDTTINQSGDRRVLRGGSWGCYPRLLYVAERGHYPPNYRGYDDGFGFRVVVG